MKRAGVLVLLGLVTVFANSQINAAPIYLAPGDGLPDFTASWLKVAYDSGSDQFQATGWTTAYTNGSVLLSDSDFGDYSLTATITSEGALTSGTLVINGDIGSGVTNLLTGTLNTGPSGEGGAFGFGDGEGNIFQFLFTVKEGNSTIVSDFGGVGAANRGIILTACFQNGGTRFTGSWTNDFSNDGYSGVSDNFVVPEPSSVLLFLIGGALCAAARRLTALRVPARQTLA